MWLFYVPKNTAKVLEFVLQDSSGDLLYQATFRTNGQAGVITINLPTNSSLPSLEVGKEYIWSFSIVCDQELEANPTVEGTIKRLQPNQQLITQLAASEGRERVVYFAKNGYWQDALVTLAQLRQQNPTDSSLKADWEQLLKAVGLEAIASEPLINNEMRK